MKTFLSIVIPLYNEETLIIDVLKKIESVNFPSFIDDFEIVIVDDYSTDSSHKHVQDYISNKTNFHLYKHEKNQGKGAAVRTGFSHANGNILLIQDADLELTPTDIPSMLIVMNELNVEFVNGSRYLSGISRPLASYKRYLANSFFTFLTSIIVDVKLTDMACGYKLIHRNLLNEITLKENRFGFEAEIILKALRIKRNNIAEVPVHYFPRNSGDGKKLQNFDGFKILWTIIKFGLLRLR